MFDDIQINEILEMLMDYYVYFDMFYLQMLNIQYDILILSYNIYRELLFVCNWLKWNTLFP